MIAVIIVTFNGLKWIDKCIGNINKDLYRIIVTDNGSTDGTQDHIIKNYPHVDFIQATKNLGFGKANNIGIKKAYNAGAEYIFLLNQDAWIENDTIDKLITAAKKETEYGIVSPMHLNGLGRDLDLNFSYFLAPSKSPGFYSDLYMNKLKSHLYEVSFVNAAAWLISRECIQTVGGFNPLFFLYGEDNNYAQRVKYHNFKVGICPHARIYHDRENRENPPRFSDKKIMFTRYILKKYCNPNKEASILDEKRWLRRACIKSVILFRRKETHDLLLKLRIINKLKKQILETKSQSKQKGLTFL